MADDTVTIRFGARIEDLVRGVEGVKEKLTELGEMAKTVGELFAIGFGGREIIEFVKSMAELGEQTERTSLTLGISTESVGELGGIAKLTGASMEGLTLSLSRMSLNIQRAQKEGFTPVGEALKVLGLNAKELVGLPADKYFEKFAEAVSKFNPSLNLTNALTAIGGRSFAALIPTFLEGREALERFHDALRKTGSELSESTTKGLVESKQEMTLLGLSVQGLGVTIFNQFKGTIDGVVQSLTGLVQWFRNAISEGGSMGYVFEGLARIMRGLAASVATIVFMFELLVSTVGYLGSHLTGDVAEDLVRFNKEIDNINANWQKTLDSIYGVKHEPLHVEVEKGTVGAMDTGGKDQLAAQLAAIQERVKLSGMAYQSYVEQLDTEVKTFSLTESEKTRLQIEAINNRVAAEKHYVEQELALDGLTKQERQKLQNDLTNIDAKGAADRQKIADKLKIDQVKSWETSLGQIQSAWDNQLKGLLAKTTTWKEAMKNLFADLIMVIIKEFEKIVIVEQLANVMQKAFAGFDLTGIFKAIAASVGQVFAAATAYFTPTLGPSAPVAGAAVAAATATGAAALAGAAEQGAWMIPATSPWLLHRGETVLPEKAATAFRNMASGGGGGGGTVIIQGWDGADIVRTLNRHAALLSRVVGGHMAANPSSHS